jgi:hypothetical protein
MVQLYYVPQYKTTTLSVAGGIDTSQTTDIVLASIPADVDTTKPGIVCISWADPLDTDSAEWVTYTSISATKELQGVTRAQEGYSAKAHNNGATVAWTISKSHINNIATALNAVYDTTTDALLKATGAEINTGTEDAKIVTPKAIADSDISFPTTTETLTNKRITKRITTITSSATPTVNTDNCDCVTITALATNITSMTTNLSGTPTNFQSLIYRILDNGSARTIAWGSSFQAMGADLPTTTTASKVLTVGFIYDTVDSKWGCVGVSEEL